MNIVHADQMEWGGRLTAHRGGHMTHKVLFEGEEGSPDNYLLVLANESSDYYSPRHRHPWDQVRYCLEGAIPVGEGSTIQAGEIGYFPEGVRYGPQRGGPDRIVLLLQVGGASGQGYLSPAQLEAGRAGLAAEGHFEAGVFKRSSASGEKHEDAYEAIWRGVTGRPLEYPEPRYAAPVILRPEAFAWAEVPDMFGTRSRWLGQYPDRDLSLEMIATASGCACTSEAAPLRRLLFVIRGEGQCNGAAYRARSAVRLEPGEAATFMASKATELLAIGVPTLGAA
ncbi:MAG: hypothetical protein ACREU3_03500 [Steroidobacteraceae bacterium]